MREYHRTLLRFNRRGLQREETSGNCPCKVIIRQTVGRPMKVCNVKATTIMITFPDDLSLTSGRTCDTWCFLSEIVDVPDTLCVVIELNSTLFKDCIKTKCSEQSLSILNFELY